MWIFGSWKCRGGRRDYSDPRRCFPQKKNVNRPFNIPALPKFGGDKNNVHASRLDPIVQQVLIIRKRHSLSIAHTFRRPQSLPARNSPNSDRCSNTSALFAPSLLSLALKPTFRLKPFLRASQAPGGAAQSRAPPSTSALASCHSRTDPEHLRSSAWLSPSRLGRIFQRSPSPYFHRGKLQLFGRIS